MNNAQNHNQSQSAKSPLRGDLEGLHRMLLNERRVNGLFNALIRSVSEELRKWKETGNRNVWVRNTTIENRINRLLADFERQLEKLIKDGQLESWRLANGKNDDLVSRYIRGLAVSDIARNGMFLHNMQAFSAFQSRVENGMNLSDRVWKITEQTKENLELYLKSGIATGRSAAGISRDIRQLLDDPDKRFRRVRDENGNLVPSQPMKNYHPGAGKYRSAYKNALRLTATEINRAYCEADAERWQQLDFVLGYEVHRSRSAKDECKVCDALVGKYPKEFTFIKWHPFCICFAVPVLMNDRDFAEYLKTGKVPPDAYITDIPESAREFFENNPKFVEKSFVGQLNFENGDVNKPMFGSQQISGVNQKEKLPFDKYEGKFVEIDKKTAIEKLQNLSDREESYSFLKDGTVYHKTGGKTSVNFTSEERKLFKDADLYHSHPFFGIMPLSKNDIRFLLQNNLNSINAVAGNTQYRMSRTHRTEFNVGRFNEFYEKITKDMSESTVWFRRDANDFYNAVNTAIAREFGMTYTIREIPK